METRAIAPCFVRPQSSPVVLLLIPPKGRAERWAFHRARGARDAGTATDIPGPCAERHREPLLEEQTAGPPSIIASRRQPAPEAGTAPCVPHANGFFSLLHIPVGVATADASPFVRAVARTCTWAVRPLRRVIPFHRFKSIARSEASSRAGIVAATAARST